MYIIFVTMSNAKFIGSGLEAAPEVASSPGPPTPITAGQDVAVSSLEDATSTGDVPRICAALGNLKQQLSEKSHKDWLPDGIRRLWASVHGAISASSSPEVGAHP